jgi:hypothetical protein
MSDPGLIILGLVIVFGALLILRSFKNFIINAIAGLVVLFLANAIVGLNIDYNWLNIVICGIGGVLGAFLVILFHMLGYAV